MPQEALDEIITSRPVELEAVEVKWVGSPPKDRLPSGTYHTDASGGNEGSDSLLRRCGCGFAQVTTELELVFGGYFPLPGDKQTVPRGELFTVIGVVCLAEVGAKIEIVSLEMEALV